MAKKQIEWIEESEAAKTLGYKPKTLRQYAREGKLPIDYTKLNYRTYQYEKGSIDRYKLANSTLSK